ncbi:hypothetical protein A3K80_01190 [Candidatus Bathyarchaeota archaeon RBG_13_38_9]|nr:MAG: hypothetical protein A3K80_01190 [Candidatus Bathyarchaeota archaeon RBG_13_38_9]
MKRELLSVFLGVIAAFTLVSLTIEPETNLRSEMSAAKMTYEGGRIETADLIDEKPTKHYEYFAIPFSFLAAIIVYQTSIRRLG